MLPDFRARLQPKSFDRTQPTNDILGPKSNDNILFPLWSTGGVLFPYTPAISTGMAAEYDPTSFIHSNYGYNAYVRSYPKPISITAQFTAQTYDEAIYMLAMMHFFKSVTKMYFGINPYQKAGTPPPTLVFNYLGDYQFNNVPVIVKSFDYSFENTTQFIPISTSGKQLVSNDVMVTLPSGTFGGYTYVPTQLTVRIDLDTQYAPNKIKNEFNLDDFRSGKMINKGYI